MTASIPTRDTALLLVDVQNAFLDPDGMVARMAGGSLDATYTDTIEPAHRSILAARAAGIPVIYTQHQWKRDFSDKGFLAEEILPLRFDGDAPEDIKTLVEGSWEAEIFPLLAPVPGEHVVPKNRYDAFVATTLEQLLQRLGVRNLVIAGLVTTICVESTTRSASMRDYRTFLVGDAIGDAEPLHAGGLERLAANFGHLVSSHDVAATWAPDGVTAGVAATAERSLA